MSKSFSCSAESSTTALSPHFSMISSFTMLTEMNGVRLQVRIAPCREVGMPGVEVEMLGVFTSLGVSQICTDLSL